MDAQCRIELLGGLRVVQDERVITRFQTRMTALLLAYLALNLAKNHPRELLIELLWPEVEPEVGRHRLSMALSSLRRQLEPPGVPAGAVVLSDRFTVGLNPSAIVTDVGEFLGALRDEETASKDAARNVALRQAIDRYQGELLPGFYDEWVLQERHRLQALFEQAREVLNDRAPDLPSSPVLPAVTAPTPPTAQRGPHNVHLPLQFTPFFGREEELVLLSRWCVGKPEDPTHHLITLTGPGGTGKTRLAIEAASRLADSFTGGIWFVPLQDLADPRLIPGTVLDALRLPRSPQTEPLHQAVEFLNARSSATLLVLDNMEQLLGADRRKAEDGAAVVRALLDRCPLLTCLVTSRQSLDLEGERELPVPPLPTPASEPQRHRTHSFHAGLLGSQPPTPEALMHLASVQLFVDRAQSSKPDFQVTAGNAAAIAQLCERLEGIPLALVLAAGRAQVMTPRQMLSELEHRFDFLVSRRRDATERHRTLRAAMEWSYRLLSPELRRFFARLSVFRGGWSVEAAEAVCRTGAPEDAGPVPTQALDSLAQLRECSLILSEERGGEMHFRMLETLREFACEHLKLEHRAAAEQQHAHYFLSLAEEAWPNLQGPAQAAWLDRLEVEHDNLRAALAWSMQEGQRQSELGLRLAAKVAPFWSIRGYQSEGREHLAALLARYECVALTPERAGALHAAGKLSSDQGAFEDAKELFEQCLSIYRALDDRIGLATSIGELGIVAYRQGDFDRARALCEESLASHRALSNPRGIAHALCRMGLVAQYQGDNRSAQSLYAESLAIYRDLSDTASTALLLMNLGNVALQRGDYTAANELLAESLAMQRQLGNSNASAMALNALGNVAHLRGDFAAARAFHQDCLAIYRELGNKHGVAGAQVNLGAEAERQGDYAAARKLYEDSLAVFRELGARQGVADIVGNLGGLAEKTGDLRAAWAFHRESLALRQALGDREGILYSLRSFTRIALARAQLERAVRLRGAEEVHREDIGYVFSSITQQDFDRDLTEARTALGEEAFAAAWTQGQAMTMEQAIDYALITDGT